MKCPNENCDFETESNQDMITHLPLHEKIVTDMNEYGYHVEIYTNRKGELQITAGAKADSINEVLNKTFKLYELARIKAKGEGYDCVEKST